jgi:2,4-dienoyl-CoA reductase-like NADH-dependent reductase (Old Yellow Enzyme family)
MKTDMASAFEPLTFKRGPAMPNRFMLAPLTNQQSHADGTLSEEEYNWLMMRAKGGFGATMTAAAHVQPGGQAFPGQIGICDDAHIPALARLAANIKAEGSVAVLQLFHGGMRADTKLSGLPLVAPSDDPKTGARAMSLSEVEEMIEAFIAAAQRAEKAGFDGVELHGAHTYLLCAFLGPEYNRRDDRYGGSLENRARSIREIISGIRSRCNPQFSIGQRLSAERMGMEFAEVLTIAEQLMQEGEIDYLDMSLWDVFKEPVEEKYKGRTLLSWFGGLDRGDVRLGVAGNIQSAADVHACMEAGVDFVVIGRAAILHHDLPKRVQRDPDFRMASPPISEEYLMAEGITAPFIDYIRHWPFIVAVPAGASDFPARA